MTTKTHDPLDTMSLDGLLEEYNRRSVTKRKAKFKSKEEALKLINALPVQSASPTPAKAKVPGMLEKLKTSAEVPEEPKKIKGSKREPKNVRARMADVVIRITPPDGEGPEWNPRRPDSQAWKHFEAMKGGITVRQYLAKFSEKDQRTARQWLWNTIQDGHVKTLGA